MKTAGAVILVLVVLLLAGGIGWVVFARLRAQKLGLPPPSWSSFIPFYQGQSAYGVQPAPSGIRGWFSDRLRSLKGRNSRTAAGAYEGAMSGGGGRTRAGFGPLDPDEAWDSRVGAEADAFYYNEEQELGLHTSQGPRSGAGVGAGGSRLDVSNTSYLGSGALGGSTYDMNVPAAAEEVRGRSRGRSPQPGSSGNPFDDNADPANVSLRGVSPRPITDTKANTPGGDKQDSPTERRSMFHENV